MRKEIPLNQRTSKPVTLDDVIHHALSRNYNWLIGNHIDILNNEGNRYEFECEYTELDGTHKSNGVYIDISNSVIGVNYYYIVKETLGHQEFDIEVPGKETIKVRRSNHDAGFRFRVKKADE